MRNQPTHISALYSGGTNSNLLIVISVLVESIRDLYTYYNLVEPFNTREIILKLHIFFLIILFDK